MRRYVITGAPGTGKTALVEALASLVSVVAEPARELISEHRAATGEPSLDDSAALFVERLVDRSIQKYEEMAAEVAVYDRGLPDCAAYARVLGVDPSPALAESVRRRYENPVFLAPPWKEIYAVDEMRRATFDQVVAFHEALVTVYRSLDYQICRLPLTPVPDRVAVVEAFLAVSD